MTHQQCLKIAYLFWTNVQILTFDSANVRYFYGDRINIFKSELYFLLCFISPARIQTILHHLIVARQLNSSVTDRDTESN